jgi:hypothetical protein
MQARMHTRWHNLANVEAESMRAIMTTWDVFLRHRGEVTRMLMGDI